MAAKKSIGPAARLARSVVRLYQLTLSGALGGQCRFEPTCSQYALDAFAAYGFWRGLLKSLIRISKCHPFHPGGYDPV